MTRGNARQDIVHDDEDRIRVLTDLERTAHRFEWEVLAFAIMSNHLHLLLRMSRPNLAKRMQVFLSGYALWSERRRRRPGHLFQGRYKPEMIEDETDCLGSAVARSAATGRSGGGDRAGGYEGSMTTWNPAR